METTLRPLTLGEILDRTAQLYRTNFLLFTGIFSVYSGVCLVIGLLQLGLKQLLTVEHLAARFGLLEAAISVIGMLVVFLLLGAAIAAVSKAVAAVHLGEAVTIRGAYASTLPKLGRYLWVMCITFVIAWLPFVLLYGAFMGVFLHFQPQMAAAGAGAGGPISPAQRQAAMAMGIAGIVFILLIFPVGIYSVWMNLRYSLAVPACVVEGLKARRAIGRSVELSKDGRGRIFVLLLLVAIINYALVGLTQMFVFVAAFKHRGQISPGLTALSQVIGFFTNTFLGPIGAAGLTLFYYDQRVRKEGFDIEWMMAAAGLTIPASDIVVDEIAGGRAMEESAMEADVGEAGSKGPAPGEGS